MKITKRRLKEIILEEIAILLKEKKNLFKKAKIIPYNFDWDLMNE